MVNTLSLRPPGLGGWRQQRGLRPGIRAAPVNILGGSQVGLLHSVLDAFFLSSPGEGKGAWPRWTPDADPAGGPRDPVPGDAPLRASEGGLQLRGGALSMKGPRGEGGPAKGTRSARGSGQWTGGSGSLRQGVK